MRGEEYLTKPQQYALVYSKGSSRASNLVVLRTLANGLTLTRYGFSVSKRVGKAVTRNRVKRRLREILRGTSLKSGWDIVFITRPMVATTDFATLKKSVEALLSRAGLLGKKGEKGLLTGAKAGGDKLAS